MEAKKNLLTREGLKKYEDELHELKVVKRKEVAQKIKEAREQGDLSENAEYDAAKDEQRDIEARIEELEKILKNVEVGDMDEDGHDLDKVSFEHHPLAGMLNCVSRESELNHGMHAFIISASWL